MRYASQWFLGVVLLCSAAAADPPAVGPAGQAVSALLREFLANAGGRDPGVYDRFFADDVVYTRSSGAFTTKAAIMENVRKPSSDPPMKFSAEDLTVHEFGDTVVVAFRLVGATEAGGKTEILRFRDTGTFLKRNGKWQVVAWQATKIEEPPAK